jgi:hypothetical protein
VLLAAPLAICRLEPEAAVPEWVARSGAFSAVSRSPEELSLVVEQAVVPPGVRCHRGYRAFRVAGTLAPDLIGIMASIANPLAQAGIPIFAVSTYDTDYVLVREADLPRARAALEAAGHRVMPPR